MNVLYKKQQNCLVNGASESCGNKPGSLPEGATILDKINGKPRPPPPPPPPPPNQGWEMARGFIVDLRGNRGLLFHFILSKIVGTMNVTMWQSADIK